MNAHVLGFPRMGANRELKWALEKYWRGECSNEQLIAVADELKERHWAIQIDAGLDLITVGDFSLYDHVLDTAVMVGAVPERFEWDGQTVGLTLYFHLARGDAKKGVHAMEMTKWFDTNYHYIVPELDATISFRKTGSRLIEDVEVVKAMGAIPKPVIVGPVTFLMLAKEKGVERWEHFDSLLDVYTDIISELSKDCPWIQIDEPVLCFDLSEDEIRAFNKAYPVLKKAAKKCRLLLTTYFGELKENLDVVIGLPVDGLHVDLVRGREQFDHVLSQFPDSMTLSLGLVDGRNLWKTDLESALKLTELALSKFGDSKVMVGSSCSLLHSPMDVVSEDILEPELKNWMAFAVQKCSEIGSLKGASERDEEPYIFKENAAALLSRKTSKRAVDEQVRKRVESLSEDMLSRASGFMDRHVVQRQSMNLPLFPTTTIGSYPQTTEIRKTRLAFKRGEIPEESYKEFMQSQIREVVERQEELGLDVLVHGESERNDMVEYFGQQLDGYCFTSNGWVQSYGSRCVKPPIIYGDVSRPAPMTLEWSGYAQSLTDKPMKGMLTGPVTMLCWSFVRDDIPRDDVCRQLALAIRDEVLDLEKSGISVIQIDEAALREGMPIRTDEQPKYLRWAVDCFRIASSGVNDSTQIHSHMCYSEFNAIVEWIAEMDADVISIEASRSGMDLLEAFDAYEFPSDIGPGVYDIHSPRIPEEDEMYSLLEKALEVIPAERLWVNPDCGLKTRGWSEVLESLGNMVGAAQRLRANHGG